MNPENRERLNEIMAEHSSRTQNQMNQYEKGDGNPNPFVWLIIAVVVVIIGGLQ